MIVIPERFATETVMREGTTGRAWLDQLTSLVDTLCRQWRLQIDGLVMHGGLALAVPVLRGDDACVLKVFWVDGSTTWSAELSQEISESALGKLIPIYHKSTQG